MEQSDKVEPTVQYINQYIDSLFIALYSGLPVISEEEGLTCKHIRHLNKKLPETPPLDPDTKKNLRGYFLQELYTAIGVKKDKIRLSEDCNNRSENLALQIINEHNGEESGMYLLYKTAEERLKNQGYSEYIDSINKTTKNIVQDYIGSFYTLKQNSEEIEDHHQVILKMSDHLDKCFSLIYPKILNSPSHLEDAICRPIVDVGLTMTIVASRAILDVQKELDRTLNKSEIGMVMGAVKKTLLKEATNGKVESYKRMQFYVFGKESPFKITVSKSKLVEIKSQDINIDGSDELINSMPEKIKNAVKNDLDYASKNASSVRKGCPALAIKIGNNNLINTTIDKFIINMIGRNEQIAIK